jgi:hypothetical protein
MADFARPPATPRSITYTSADSAYAAYGWNVATHRKVREFSTLVAASRAGFALRGSGSATVVTPAVYHRHALYRIRIRGRTRTIDTGPAGRLTIQVPLGPSDNVQEYPADGPAAGTTVYTTTVSIRATR